MMVAPGENQHRWKKSIDGRIRELLDEAATGLKWAWKMDQQSPRSYPLNTWYTLLQLEQELEDKPARQQKIKLPHPPRPPKTLSELLDERMVAAIYEEQNQGTYRDALREAARDPKQGLKIWRRIMHAANFAYLVHFFGVQAIPKPKTQFLHRTLLDLLDSLDIGLTPEGRAEFFDDMCPCGTRHKPDSIDRLARRRERGRG